MEGQHEKKKKIQLLCSAKINLSLDVTGKKENGYHTLDSIFQTVSVYDTITMSIEDGKGIFLQCSQTGIPCDERNLAYRAADAFLKAFGITKKISILLEKQIPSGAGMGGGSADAAGVLYALYQLTNHRCSYQKLLAIALELGADVPFLLTGGTVFAQGIGEILTPLQPWNDLPLVILKGKESISTPAAYQAIDRLENPVHPDTKAMLQAIETQDFALLCKSCENLFESAIACQEVTRAKQALQAHGAACAVMTGSGAAVFGIFQNRQTAEACAESLQSEFAFAAACRTHDKPFVILQEQEVEF